MTSTVGLSPRWRRRTRRLTRVYRDAAYHAQVRTDDPAWERDRAAGLGDRSVQRLAIPDGTVIEVSRVSWVDLLPEEGRGDPTSHDEILVARDAS
jgi:hypothetical protein